MKKSEVVKEIKNILLDWDNEVLNDHHEEISKKILEMIESLDPENFYSWESE